MARRTPSGRTCYGLRCTPRAPGDSRIPLNTVDGTYSGQLLRLTQSRRRTRTTTRTRAVYIAYGDLSSRHDCHVEI